MTLPKVPSLSLSKLRTLTIPAVWLNLSKVSSPSLKSEDIVIGRGYVISGSIGAPGSPSPVFPIFSWTSLSQSSDLANDLEVHLEREEDLVVVDERVTIDSILEIQLSRCDSR